MEGLNVDDNFALLWGVGWIGCLYVLFEIRLGFCVISFMIWLLF